MFAVAAAGLAAAVVGALLLGLRARLHNRLQGGAGLAVLVIPVAAVGVYLVVGSPAFIAPHDSLARTEASIRTLERQAAARPAEPAPLINLAQALDDAGRYREAGEAWKRVAALEGEGQAEALQRAAHSLILSNGMQVTGEVADLIARILVLEPANVHGRFYDGLAKFQSGQPAAALAIWTGLLADVPPDSPLRSSLEAGIEEAEARTGASAPVPGVPEDSQIRAMVDGLAARLAENPGDLDGWKRLGRSRRVLNEFTESYEAYMQAVALAPDDVTALAGAAEALAFASGDPRDPPAEAVMLFRRVLELDPDHALALYVVGEDAAGQGDRVTAAALLGRLLQQLPPDDPMHETIARRLEQIVRE